MNKESKDTGNFNVRIYPAKYTNGKTVVSPLYYLSLRFLSCLSIHRFQWVTLKDVWGASMMSTETNDSEGEWRKVIDFFPLLLFQPFPSSLHFLFHPFLFLLIFNFFFIFFSLSSVLSSPLFPSFLLSSSPSLPHFKLLFHSFLSFCSFLSSHPSRLFLILSFS